MRGLGAALCVTVFILTACTSDDGSEAAPTAQPASGMAFREILGGLDSPLGIASTPSEPDRLFVVDYAAQGGSVLFSSTDIDEVRAIAHRIYVMHAGEVTAEFDNVGPGRPARTDLTHAISVDPRLESLVR